MTSVRLASLAFVLLYVLACAGVAKAEDISGVLSITKIVVENSQLVGDVTCTMTTTPCIQFGAPNIALRLNGHTITGPANPDDSTTCQPTSGPVHRLRTESATGSARPRASQAYKSSAPAWSRSSGGMGFSSSEHRAQYQCHGEGRHLESQLF